MIKRVYTDNPTEQAAQHLINSLEKHLEKGEKVLLLLSGGSGINIAVKISDALKNLNLSNLYVSLMDERHGEIGHANENWQQLLDAEFKLVGANLYRPLINKSLKETAESFSIWLDEKIKITDYKIALFGIGSDGHTAGIKPHSAAVNCDESVAYFSGEDFERFTITPKVIQKIDEAVIQASGDDKRPTLYKLINEQIPLDDQPAQILKSVKNATLYTNNKEEK